MAAFLAVWVALWVGSTALVYALVHVRHHARVGRIHALMCAYAVLNLCALGLILYQVRSLLTGNQSGFFFMLFTLTASLVTSAAYVSLHTELATDSSLLAVYYCGCGAEITGQLFCKACGVAVSTKTLDPLSRFLRTYTITRQQANYYELMGTGEAAPANPGTPSHERAHLYEDMQPVPPAHSTDGLQQYAQPNATRPPPNYYEDCAAQHHHGAGLGDPAQVPRAGAARGETTVEMYQPTSGEGVAGGRSAAAQVAVCMCDLVTIKAFCTHCGKPPRTRVSHYSKFCSQCGRRRQPGEYCTHCCAPTVPRPTPPSMRLRLQLYFGRARPTQAALDGDGTDAAPAVDPTATPTAAESSDDRSSSVTPTAVGSPEHDLSAPVASISKRAPTADMSPGRRRTTLYAVYDFLFEVYEQRAPHTYGKRLPKRRLFLLVACACLGAYLFKVYLHDRHTPPKAKLQRFLSDFDGNLVWPKNGTSFDNLLTAYGRASARSDDICLLAWSMLLLSIFVESMAVTSPRNGLRASRLTAAVAMVILFIGIVTPAFPNYVKDLNFDVIMPYCAPEFNNFVDHFVRNMVSGFVRQWSLATTMNTRSLQRDMALSVIAVENSHEGTVFVSICSAVVVGVFGFFIWIGLLSGIT